MVEYDDKLAQETERMYLMPDIVTQRQRTIEILAPRAGESILDIGCGMGLLTRDLALSVGEDGRVVGVDNSQSMLSLAKHRCQNLPQVTLEYSPAVPLVAPDHTFDAVTCVQLLLYLDDVPAALAEMTRVLKPGGRVAIIDTDWHGAVWNTPDDAYTRELIAEWDAAVPSPNLPPKLPGMLSTAGFTNIQVTAIPIVNLDFLPGNYSSGMAEFLVDLRHKKLGEPDQKAIHWVHSLKQMSRSGNYFFCINRFLFTATLSG